MPNINYRIDDVDLQAEIKKLLNDYGDEVTLLMNEELDQLAKEAKKKITSNSRKAVKGSRYYRGWAIDKTDTAKLFKSYTLFNKNQPSLTHLLEFGHDVVRKGRKVGRAGPHPHIAPVNDWIVSELPKRIKRLIEEIK